MKYNGIEIDDISLVVNGDHATLPNDPVNTMSASGVRDMIDAMEVMASVFDHVGQYYFVVWRRGNRSDMIRVDDYDLFTD